jgi:molybdenum cofactor cytidylyltransferase
MTEAASEDQKKIGGIVLAAGGSSRMGRPKQLLQFEGKTLLRRAAESMAASMCDPVVAVLGAESKKTAAEIAGLPVRACINEDWENGMGSSIKTGLNEMLRAAPDISAVVIMLCDQPFITAEQINNLVTKFTETQKPIIAAEYNGVAGVPALFSKEMFDALSQIEGDKGARELIRNSSDATETVPMPEAGVDVDTLDDYDRLKLK